MASGTIQLTPDQLRGEAKKVRSIKNNHDAEMKNLFRLVGNLETIWKGDSQQAYYNKVNSARGTFEKFSTMLEEFAALMDYSANELEANDAELANKVAKATSAFD